jgi:hypothetical protein
MKELNQIEKLVLQKISEWPSWGIDLMRDLTKIVEPIYAADMLRETVNNMSTKEEEDRKQEDEASVDNDELLTDQRAYNFNTNIYDNNATIPSAGLFFATIDSHRPVKKSRESNQSRSNQSSRAASSYSEIHRAKSAISIIPSPKSQSALSFHPQDHDGVPGDMTNSSYNPIGEENDNPYSNLRHVEDFNETSYPPLDESDLHHFDNFDNNHSSVTMHSKPHTDSNDSNASYTVSSRSGSSAGSVSKITKKHKPAFFPPADVKLGGLGPDRDNEIYLSKVESPILNIR